jgi:hypothetical protein
LLEPSRQGVSFFVRNVHQKRFHFFIQEKKMDRIRVLVLGLAVDGITPAEKKLPIFRSFKLHRLFDKQMLSEIATFLCVCDSPGDDGCSCYDITEQLARTAAAVHPVLTDAILEHSINPITFSTTGTKFPNFWLPQPMVWEDGSILGTKRTSVEYQHPPAASPGWVRRDWLIIELDDEWVELGETRGRSVGELLSKQELRRIQLPLLWRLYRDLKRRKGETREKHLARLTFLCVENRK